MHLRSCFKLFVVPCKNNQGPEGWKLGNFAHTRVSSKDDQHQATQQCLFWKGQSMESMIVGHENAMGEVHKSFREVTRRWHSNCKAWKVFRKLHHCKPRHLRSTEAAENQRNKIISCTVSTQGCSQNRRTSSSKKQTTFAHESWFVSIWLQRHPADQDTGCVASLHVLGASRS